MPRTPLMRTLRGIARRAAAAANPPGDGPRRGEFLRALGGAAAAAALPLGAGCASSGAKLGQRVAIVGAGIAGLTTARLLADAGVASTVYEASARVGGRMHSERSYWAQGQHTEWCGAMVDSDHRHVRGLARRFGLRLLDTDAARPPGARDTCFLDGRYYAMADADRDFAAVYPILRDQLEKLPDYTTYKTATRESYRLDAMSMAKWIARYVPGGLNSQLGRLIDVAYLNEYGREAEELSALSLVTQLGEQPHYNKDGRIDVLGDSDQKYIFERGSQALPEAIAASLPPDAIRLGHRLLVVAKSASGSGYDLTFDVDGKPEQVNADRVVLAIPFIVLRGLDIAGAGFSAAKNHAIANLGYGYHTKLHVQFDKRAWMRPGHPWPEPASGQIWTTQTFQCALDFSLGQAGSDGLIEVFTAAGAGMLDTPAMPYATIADSPAVGRHVQAFFKQLDRIWPGVAPTWNGKATFGNAQADPNALASYSVWLVGQCTTIAGHEATPEGGVHFAGEHTSIAYQGFMEGGAQSGYRVAKEILGS